MSNISDRDVFRNFIFTITIVECPKKCIPGVWITALNGLFKLTQEIKMCFILINGDI